MMGRTSTTIAALALLALSKPGWSADPPPIENTDMPRLFAPPPLASETESPSLEKTGPPKFIIRDPAMAAPIGVKRANHEAEVISKQHVLLAQFDEEKNLESLHEVTDDLQLDLQVTDAAEEAARDAANEAVDPLGFPTVDAQDGRTPIPPSAERRYADRAYQPWTIPGLFNGPEEYQRQACEEEFCRQVWACAGGRQSSWFQRWRRDMRRGREFRSMGRCGRCNASSSLLSCVLVEPLLGCRLGGPPGVCGRCQSATGLWDDHCVDGGTCSSY